MGYRIEHPERVSVEIRRVAAERLDSALSELRNGVAEHPAESVHAARKDLKKTRSLLRLVRENMRDERYRAENDRIRKAAHALAALRESDAMTESLAALLESSQRQMTAGCAKDAAAWLSQLRSAPRAEQDVAVAAATAAVIIETARDDARMWSLDLGGWELVEPGLRKAYRRGRDGLALALESPDDNTVHEWRKRVKDLWYDLRLLRDVWPAAMEPMAEEVHSLSELLGDHHDLSELARAALGNDNIIRDEYRAELADHARTRQADLLEEAGPLGARIYAERPRAFTERIGAYWSAWEGEPYGLDGKSGLPSS